MKALAKNAREILRSSVTHSWYVSEDNFADVCELFRRGLVRVYDDTDILGIAATKKGIALALRLKIVRRPKKNEIGIYARVGEYMFGDVTP